MKTRRLLPRVLLLAALALLCAGPTFAQVDAEHMMSFSLAFTNPGARAHGMGGAFLGLSDDASTVFVNPAGMAYFESSQGSIEYSYGDTPVFSGRYDGGRGYLPKLTTEDNGVTYLSYAHPLGNGWAVGLYHVVLMRTDFSHTYPAYTTELGGSRYQVYRSRVSLRASYEVSGLSLAKRLSDSFILGISIGQSRLRLHGSTVRDYTYQDPSTGDLYPEIHYYINKQENDASDRDLMLVFGLYWRITDALSLGATWQNEQEFSVSATGSFMGLWFGDPWNFQQVPSNQTIKMPTRYGLGLAYRLGDNFTFSVEADRIQYGDIYENATRSINYQKYHPYLPRYTCPDIGKQPVLMDDVTEYHAGLEILVPGEKTVLALRAGWWRDESHYAYANEKVEPLTRLVNRTSPTYEHVNHYTAGFGLTFKNVVIDFAGDWTGDGYDATRYYLSMLFRM